METRFSAEQLQDPLISRANSILRACVHCGFCNATCPTYVLSGDERDGPRGRIYMMRDILQEGRHPEPTEARHLDRCLSCLSCMTTCPADVDYRHLIDPMRVKLNSEVSRPLGDRLFRYVLAKILPKPTWAGFLLVLAQPFRPILQRFGGFWGRLFKAIPQTKIGLPLKPGVYPAEGKRKYRVILLPGCIQQVIAPEINNSTLRILQRLGTDVIIPEAGGCCGSVSHHLGVSRDVSKYITANLRAWQSAEELHGQIDAVISNATGCGAMLRDYKYLFSEFPEWADAARRFSPVMKDACEFIREVGFRLDLHPFTKPRIAWQSPCSLQHGVSSNTSKAAPDLLEAAGFKVLRPSEEHICCGSAGTYNILQGEISEKLKLRKCDALNALKTDVVATSNIGCLTHLSRGLAVPIVHVLELLDWASGGPVPEGIDDSRGWRS